MRKTPGSVLVVHKLLSYLRPVVKNTQGERMRACFWATSSFPWKYLITRLGQFLQKTPNQGGAGLSSNEVIELIWAVLLGRSKNAIVDGLPTSPYQFSVQSIEYTRRENDKGLEEIDLSKTTANLPLVAGIWNKKRVFTWHKITLFRASLEKMRIDRRAASE